MKTFSIETKDVKDNIKYFILNMPTENLKPIMLTDWFRGSLTAQSVKPTGRVFIANSSSDKESASWHDKLPAGSEIHLKMTEFDLLAEKYVMLEDQKKALEKSIKTLLKSAPDHTFEGYEFGGFDEFTTSSSLAYAQLYDKAKQELLKLDSKESKMILAILMTMENSMSTPHKGSSKTFKVFKLNDETKSEFNKIWRG